MDHVGFQKGSLRGAMMESFRFCFHQSEEDRRKEEEVYGEGTLFAKLRELCFTRRNHACSYEVCGKEPGELRSKGVFWSFELILILLLLTLVFQEKRG
jgi:hypothetical protein